jgi:signal transduction histidine kinase
MFHQIRTPLNIISGFAQVLQTDSDSLEDEDLDSISKGILQNSKSMATIIDNLHIVSSLEDATSVELNDTLHVNGICQQAIERVTLIHPHTVSLTMETHLPDNFLLRTHRAYLQKILSELLENANKFTKVGLIILRCQQYDPRFVEITVSDTGQGIPPADRERIFSLFTKLSTFSEGLGLGLYLTRRLARLMGGDLRLDDTYVGGTRFILQLPV